MLAWCSKKRSLARSPALTSLYEEERLPWQLFFPGKTGRVSVVCAGMITVAIIDWWKFKVPNKLTFPLILSGWLLGLLNLFQLVPYGGQGWIGDALGGTFLACASWCRCMPSVAWVRAMSR